MKLAEKVGQNEYIYRVVNPILIDENQPFIIKTLLKTNLSFKEKKEILENINFDKADTLIKYENLNVYNSAMINVPVYTHDTYFHRNEIAKPEEDLDELLSYIYEKNPVNLNEIAFNDSLSVLSMLVVLGLTNTLDKAFSFMDNKEKEAFINNTFIDLNTEGLSHNYTEHKMEHIYILPVISWNMPMLRVFLKHGLNVNAVNKDTNEGLGFYLNSKHMINELETEYDFHYNLEQTNEKGKMLGRLLKSVGEGFTLISCLHTTLKNEMNAFIDSRISDIPLSSNEVLNLLTLSFKKDTITNFKKVYDSLAEKINWNIPETEIDLSVYLSCRVEDYNKNQVAVSKILYMKKDFEKRGQYFDNELVFFNVIGSFSDGGVAPGDTKKLKQWFSDESIDFKGINLLKIHLRSYEVLSILFKTGRADYNADLELFDGKFRLSDSLLGFYMHDEYREMKTKDVVALSEKIEESLKIAVLYDGIMLDPLISVIQNHKLEDKFKHVCDYRKMLARNKSEALSPQQQQCVFNLLNKMPEFAENMHLSLSNNYSRNYDYSFRIMLENNPSFISLIEKYHLDKNTGNPGLFDENVQKIRL